MVVTPADQANELLVHFHVFFECLDLEPGLDPFGISGNQPLADIFAGFQQRKVGRTQAGIGFVVTGDERAAHPDRLADRNSGGRLVRDWLSAVGHLITLSVKRGVRQKLQLGRRQIGLRRFFGRLTRQNRRIR